MAGPGRSGLIQSFGRVAGAAVIGILCAIPLTLAVLAANFASTKVAREPIRAHVGIAFDAGDLDVDHLKAAAAYRGQDQFNDCVILFMALDEGGSRIGRALSPRKPLDGVTRPCAELKRLVSEAPPPSVGYHRYLHGPTTLAAPLLNRLPLHVVRNRLAMVSMLATFGVVVAAGFNLWRAARRGNGSAVTRAGFVAVAGLCFLLFFGLSSFSMSLTHFPSAMALIGYLWVALFTDFSTMRPITLAAVHALFGVLTAWFELLTGGTPLAVCLVLYIAAAEARGSERLVRGASALAAFAAAFATAFAVKMLATAHVFGPEVLGDFRQALSHRIIGASGGDIGEIPIDAIDAARKLFWEARTVGAGSEPLGKLLIVASFLAVVYGLMLILVRRMRGEALVRPGLLIAAFGSICLWHLVFYPHSYVHAWFMVRTLVGLYFTAAMLIFCLHRAAVARFTERAARLLGEDGPRAI